MMNENDRMTYRRERDLLMAMLTLTAGFHPSNQSFQLQCLSGFDELSASDKLANQISGRR